MTNRFRLTLLLLLSCLNSIHAVAETGPSVPPGAKLATFAGGCFWCIEPPYDKLNGVLSTISGYTGGHKRDPSYEEVSSGVTGHVEAVQIVYDPAQVSYEKLLDVYWQNTDPTRNDGQFCDAGDQYRPVIFYHDEEQRLLAQLSKDELEKLKKLPAPILTEIAPAAAFYAAETYHQDYYAKNPVRYKLYRYGCGRDKRLDELWGKGAR
ncbi:MAG: peptide-methionine (S)-S-oxide reductase MsrA [Gammaproteobacteria bacterium]